MYESLRSGSREGTDDDVLRTLAGLDAKGGARESPRRDGWAPRHSNFSDTTEKQSLRYPGRSIRRPKPKP